MVVGSQSSVIPFARRLRKTEATTGRSEGVAVSFSTREASVTVEWGRDSGLLNNLHCLRNSPVSMRQTCSAVVRWVRR